jgi:cob(I)alamin adenosyltransferase
MESMSSISTKTGDTGQTGLAGGARVSKASLRVESYGTVDELNSALGFARSICDDEEIALQTKAIQQELFKLGATLATPITSRKGEPPVTAESVEALTGKVHKFEALEGILTDWSVPGEHPAGASYDVARTICRRAERCVVRLMESGEAVEPNVLAYLNRLSDLLWLFSRKLELTAGASSSLRKMNDKSGSRWSKAW